MKKTILFGLLLIGFAVQAQPQWPAITQTAKPWTRWWWMGSSVDNQNLTRLLEQYERAGLGGVEITPIYGVKGEEKSFIPFLSPIWMDRLGHTLSEAKRLKLGVDLAQASDGSATRTVLEHLGCYLIKRHATLVTLFGPRSSAQSLHHALVVAARSVV